MMNAVQTKKEKGFTLIELVMVIVILGILAAFALPRFADLGGDARLSTLQGAEGSVKSAAAIARSKWLAEGDQPGTIELDGADSVNMSDQGYPAATADGIGDAAQINDDFDLTPGTGANTNQATITIDGTAEGECEFTYDEEDGSTSGFDDNC